MNKISEQQLIELMKEIYIRVNKNQSLSTMEIIGEIKDRLNDLFYIK
ncbi:hypothetical protein [Cytobacillus horneckiae]|nr:hypothetical protein [Cytobacillus horneckiae]MCM3180812.1 hypothetical protein [Cytobacillus horneckiae]MEC1157482.1 hypothetical protein [Cytobacillus horneckiae]MED2939430.1 hypothetical protein [Cytobacillus horneckiae]